MSHPKPPPLLIHHSGFQPHVPFCLWQNRKTNPERAVILLGDATNRVQGIDYRHEEMRDYQEKNASFLAAYRHVTHSEFYKERSHLERWFILSSFLERNGIDQFYFLDSDYLLFCNLLEHEQGWTSSVAAGTPSFWGCSYFRSAEVVHGFCEWLLGLYRQERRFEAMLARYRAMGPGVGLQEMSFLHEYCVETKLSVTKLDWRHTSSSECFDDCYYGCSYFDHRTDFDLLRQKSPGGAVKVRGEAGARRLLGLHFQGHRKRQIPGFTGWSKSLAVAFLRPNYRRNMRHLFQYLWEGYRCRHLLQRP